MRLGGALPRVRAIALLGACLAAPSAFALTCVVIRGDSPEKDWNRSFEGDTWLAVPRVGGTECVSKNSWAEARAYVEAQTAAGRIKFGDELYFVQATHGGPGGSASCNAAETSANQVLNYLQGFAQKFRVGADLTSCFSGDLLRAKLEADSLNPNEDVMRNLCLITDSGFGRLGRGSGYGSLPLESNGLSMEEAYAGRKIGLISSAAWDSAGVSNYFIDRSVEMGAQVLRNMNDIVQGPGVHCRLDDQVAAAVCVHPQMDDSLLDALGKLDRAKHHPVYSETLEAAVATLAEPLPGAETLRNETFDLGPSDAARNCREFLRAKLSAAAKEAPYAGFAATTLIRQIEKWPAELAFAPCAERLRVVAEGASPGTIGQVGVSEIYARTDTLLTYLIPFHLGRALNVVHAAQLKLAQSLSALAVTGAPDLDPAEFLRLLNQAKTSKSPLTGGGDCSTRAKIVASALGEGFFGAEMYRDDGEDQPDTPDVNAYSPGRLTRAFSQASIDLPSPATLNDRLRRQACRDFKF